MFLVGGSPGKLFSVAEGISAAAGVGIGALNVGAEKLGAVGTLDGMADVAGVEVVALFALPANFS